VALTVFRDRTDAGEQLAALLVERGEAGRIDLVLGIPRGGVLVAVPVAAALDCPLDVALARKVGAPGNPELAVGAVGPDGNAVVDEVIARHAGASHTWIADAAAAQAEEVQRRLARFREGLPPLDVQGRRVVVVDDGVATGSTAAAVGQWLAGTGAGGAVLAVPVAPVSAPGRLCPPYDELVAVRLPERFFSVGEHYRRFDQTTDDEVVEALARFRRP
jgi:predicted phosphoribosyltransferase